MSRVPVLFLFVYKIIDQSEAGSADPVLYADLSCTVPDQCVFYRGFFPFPHDNVPGGIGDDRYLELFVFQAADAFAGIFSIGTKSIFLDKHRAAVLLHRIFLLHVGRVYSFIYEATDQPVCLDCNQ